MNGMKKTVSILAASLFTALATPALAQTPALENLGFMTGCWQSTPDERGTVLEENYTTPSTNLILGMSRYLRGGSAVMFEFSRIMRSDTAVVLTPHPRGVASVGFRLARLAGDTASFENPAHDFPQRIIYRRDGDGLVARVENMGGEGQEWRMTRCPAR